ncbi:hypothetical protein F5883DRAFT_435240, partial [Diaporthe sp. PMI_573]
RSRLPKYAILSHTWGSENEEVTFQDLGYGSGRDKIGFDKLEFCAARAEQDGLEYFWVDTCCINKSNKAELSNAINSIYDAHTGAPTSKACWRAFGETARKLPKKVFL